MIPLPKCRENKMQCIPIAWMTRVYPKLDRAYLCV